ncbi:MAG: hypothetical protein AAFV45_07635 [Pseudomonadota bacterium]
MGGAMIGTTAGALVGMFTFFLLQAMAERMKAKATEDGRPIPEAYGYIKIAAWGDLVVFTIIGYILGPMLLGA